MSYDQHLDIASGPETRAVLDAWQHTTVLMARHGLRAGHIEVTGTSGGKVYDFGADGYDITDPLGPFVLHAATISVVLAYSPVEFLRWCEALTVARVRVEKSGSRTDLTATASRDGYHWRLFATAPRPKTGRHRYPPAGVAWDPAPGGSPSANGWTTVPDLRNALAQIGCRHVGPDGVEAAVTPHGPTNPRVVAWVFPRAGRGCTGCGAGKGVGRLAVFSNSAALCSRCATTGTPQPDHID
ncbi:hypothetical protein ABZ671_01045 [Micromonospora sp. NPDC006766]|uniref:hypothetical protein n=1 Tax=Micromonospora sp. NPDC006766 TaxID=3154778 RepID=UPI0033FE2408